MNKSCSTKVKTDNFTIFNGRYFINMFVMILHHKFTKLTLAFIAGLFTFVSTLTFTGYSQVRYTTGEERLNGLKQRKALEENSLLGKVKFRNIGPSLMGGRVVDLDVNPKDPTEFYLAYASGGLWHTTNNGL